jgi:hypothetical protein
MLERHRLSAAIAVLGLAGGAAFSACAGGNETTTGTGGGGGATTSSSTTGSGGATTSSSTTTSSSGTGTGGGPTNGCRQADEVVLAINHLYFGDTNWDESPNTQTGWENFGLDIDGLTSTAASTDVCKPAAGASASKVHPDGPNGLDNGFGKNVLPVFLANIPVLSQQANASLMNGDFSILIRLVGLGTGPTQDAIPAKVYGGAYLDVPPNFDGNDCWPVTPESLSDATDIESAKASYPASTNNLNHWDSVSTGDIDLTLQVLGYQGHAVIHHARVVMDFDPDHNGTQKGIISGVLDTEEFVAAINKLMQSFDPANCTNGTFVQMIDTQIRQASDIMKDGTQNASATCDGISIGLGFRAARVQFGTIGDPLTPKPDPCMP